MNSQNGNEGGWRPASMEFSIIKRDQSNGNHVIKEVR
jgi:hypothetical protein